MLPSVDSHAIACCGQQLVPAATNALPARTTASTLPAVAEKVDAVQVPASADCHARGLGPLSPSTDPTATMFTEITHREVLEKGLKVADATAFSLCMDNQMPIMVFNLLVEGNIARAVRGERIGTLVHTPAQH